MIGVLAVAGMAEASLVKWAIADGGNDHWYESIADNTTWVRANEVVSARQGYLVTVTSQAENDFIVNSFGGPSAINNYLLGGFQPAGSSEPSGGWRWVYTNFTTGNALAVHGYQ